MSNARMEDTIQDVTLVILRYQITEETDLDALHVPTWRPRNGSFLSN